MSNQDYFPNQQHAARVTTEDTNTNTSDIMPIHSAAQYVTGAQKKKTNTAAKNSRPRNNNGNNNSYEPNGQQLMALIHQSTGNIERIQNSKYIRETLADAILIHGKKEKSLRQSTISYANKDINPKDISAIIDNEWVFKLNQAPVTYWNDKENLNCQFIDFEAKANFLNSGIHLKPPMFERMMQANEQGEHFKRRPIRIVINNVRPSINTTRLMEIMKNCTDFDTEITDLKDGSPHPVTKSRSVFFRINAHGLRILLEKLNGEIPYADKTGPAKARLRIRINCKPWQCKDCATIGTHQCEGRKCRNCANKGHNTKECQSTTKFCGNCKKRGHRSTDLHCPTYLNEVAKEIRKMAIPIDMFENKQLRLSLAKSVQLK